MEKSITVNVILDDKIFRQFALFENFRRKRIWGAPLIFAAIMSAFALVCFAMRARTEQAVMMGSVLLIIGLGLPAAYIGLFFKSIKFQIKAMELENPRHVYSLRFSPDGVQVISGDKPNQFIWSGMFGAYRVPGCTYLYVEKNKAFLLPDGQAEEGADVWALLAERLPAEKMRDCRESTKQSGRR